MHPFIKTVIIPVLICASPLVVAEGETDCLLEGTVVHGGQAGQDGTKVKLHAVSKYDEESSCNVRRSRKVEFKLPQDPRLQNAPSGSSVKYRYRTDEDGKADAELLSVGTSGT